MIRTLRAPAATGLSRTHWDLRRDGPARATLRTRPPDRDWVEMGEDGSRSIRTWDLDIFPGYRGALVPPGTYTARVEIGDRAAETPIVVEADPSSAATPADAAEKYAFLRAIHAQLDELADMVDELEFARRELAAFEEYVGERHAGDERFTAVLESAAEVAGTALAIEGRLFDTGLTGAREDAFRAPIRLFGRLGALANDAGRDGADFAPTDQQREVRAVLTGRFEEARAAYRDLVGTQLPALWRAIGEARAGER